MLPDTMPADDARVAEEMLASPLTVVICMARIAANITGRHRANGGGKLIYVS